MTNQPDNNPQARPDSNTQATSELLENPHPNGMAQLPGQCVRIFMLSMHRKMDAVLKAVHLIK